MRVLYAMNGLIFTRSVCWVTVINVDLCVSQMHHVCALTQVYGQLLRFICGLRAFRESKRDAGEKHFVTLACFGSIVFNSLSAIDLPETYKYYLR